MKYLIFLLSLPLAACGGGGGGTTMVSRAQAAQTTSSPPPCNVLSYQGGPFVLLVTTGPNYSLIVPLKGTVTLAAPLDPNLINEPVTPDSWNFDIEDPHFDSVNAQAELGPVPLQSTFIFSTDANGAITTWNMVITLKPGPGTEDRNLLTATSQPSGDSISASSNNLTTGNPTSITGTSNTPGTWSCYQPPPCT